MLELRKLLHFVFTGEASEWEGSQPSTMKSTVPPDTWTTGMSSLFAT